MFSSSIKVAVFSALLCTSSLASSGLLMKPTYNADIDYQKPILTHNYNTALTHPDEILGFEVGQRVASPAQITEAIGVWKTQTDRLKVVEYARSHEGRPLHAVFISSPENLANMDNILSNIAALADPRKTKDGDANNIIDGLPAVAWMAYSIHGNETSGADAALAAIYHYGASTDKSTTELLENTIIVIDPMMNPDGRDRFAKSLEQYRGSAPNVDDQSLLHRGDWPYGRTNHYFFDLNRDFFYLTQPETQGRVKLINKWRPQLMIDGHEMGPQDTYLMGPPRQPLNTNIAPSVQKWAQTFSLDQGAAFDKEGWRYYTGEWFENWYPGYSNYAEYRGSVHILYEQSRMAEDGVRRPEGTVQTYKESVHHQFISTLANIETLNKHSKAMYKDYWLDRKKAMSKDSPYADTTYVIQATNNHSRLRTLAQKLQAQDIEIYLADKDLSLKKAQNQMGVESKVNVKQGALLIPGRQPEARLLAAIMEFDAELLPETITLERQKLLREGRSIMYDTSAWNLSMMYGLEAYTVKGEISKNVSLFEAQTLAPSFADPKAIAWAVNGDDDASLAFAARLMEQGVQVRVIDKATELGQHKLVRGTVVVTTTDNPNNTDLIDLLNSTAQDTQLSIKSISTGYGKGDTPEWGGDHFVLLAQPKVAILSQADTSSYDVGSTWWSIDTHLGIRHSQLDMNSLSYVDLRRYNVIILPNAYSVPDKTVNLLSEWVKQGGTLISHNSSSAALAASDVTHVSVLDKMLDKAQEFDTALQRRLLAEQPYTNMKQVFASAVSDELAYPWDDAPQRLSKEALEQRNNWQKIFMPRGAMVLGSVDTKHWLSFGNSATLPILYGRFPVLVVPENAESVVSIGGYYDAPKGKDDKEAKALAWYSVPKGKELHVRMSGLLWPEAAQRIANSTYLSRESHGMGQIIMFAGEPIFRGATLGTNRLLLNAIVYGPGFGTQARINL